MLSASVGVAMLVIALVSFPRLTAGLIGWIAVLIAIVVFNLWSAFPHESDPYRLEPQRRRRGGDLT